MLRHVLRSTASPLCTFFGTVTLQKSLKFFFLKFFKIFQESPFNFFIFCNQLELYKAQRVPLLQFRVLDIAPFLAVPGLFVIPFRLREFSNRINLDRSL